MIRLKVTNNVPMIHINGARVDEGFITEWS
jgi:hypothetical protein